MRSVLLILYFTSATIAAAPAPHPQHETISGRVVAYSIPLACLNGNGYWSMVIRAQRTKDLSSDFIRVDFSLPCGKSPEWVSAKPSIQKFRLIRHKDCDAVLEGSIDEEPHQGPAIPIWKYPLGTEHATLPFGQVLPCYRSVDLPLVPVL
jgi:hypothetical protein